MEAGVSRGQQGSTRVSWGGRAFVPDCSEGGKDKADMCLMCLRCPRQYLERPPVLLIPEFLRAPSPPDIPSILFQNVFNTWSGSLT